ncbi:MAG TPA: SIMPL domain-containing protein [Chloroflexota bacterium]|nr:SIMPL domain-containing protein [Chloroflexota bacterium]
MRTQRWGWQQVVHGPLVVTVAAGVVLYGCSIPVGGSSANGERAGGTIVYAQGTQPTQGGPNFPGLRAPEQSFGQSLQPVPPAPPAQRSQPLDPLPPSVSRQAQQQAQQAQQPRQAQQAQQLQGRQVSQSPFAPAQGRLAQNLQGQETPVQAGQVASGEVSPELMRRMVVAGMGEVKAAPNVAHITLGVEGQAPRAREALNNVSTAANNVIASLRQLGIPERQIQTTAIDLHPVHETPPTPEPGQPLAERQGPPAIVGYRAVNQIRVRVVNMDQLGGAIDAGANIASGIQFSLENDTAARQEALRKAVQEARSEATVLAEALGVSITGVRAVVEEEAGNVLPLREVAYGAVASRAADVATPVQPGEITVRKQVQVVFDIG